MTLRGNKGGWHLAAYLKTESIVSFLFLFSVGDSLLTFFFYLQQPVLVDGAFTS